MKERFITGIYNYCDKWCERCAFQKRCSIYVDEEKFHLEQEMSNEMLISVISEKLRGLAELFEERNTFRSFTSPNTFPQSVKVDTLEQESFSLLTCEHPLIEKSYRYGREANEWFRGQHLNNYMHLFKDRIDLGIATQQQVDDELDDIQNWIDHVTRFITFIPVKLKRAHNSHKKLRKWECANGLLNDCDGSAKVAILAIDKSILGWSKLMTHFPDLEDVCLQFLAALVQLRQLTLAEFPLAMEFKRPGFDD